MNSLFWVWPEETRKTKVDLFEDVWFVILDFYQISFFSSRCAPCLRKFRREPCGRQWIALMACSSDGSDPCTTELANFNACSEDLRSRMALTQQPLSEPK